jgi:hypothetical protein
MILSRSNVAEEASALQIKEVTRCLKKQSPCKQGYRYTPAVTSRGS